MTGFVVVIPARFGSTRLPGKPLADIGGKPMIVRVAEQAAASGKPENIIQKMVDGRIDKYFKEVTVLDQPWVRDDSKSIRDLVKAAGADATIRRFARFQIGQE